VPAGDHHLVFQNTYRRGVSAYLANALAPASDRVVITAQRRDADQRTLTIDYRVGADPASLLPMWPLGVLAGAVVVALPAFAQTLRRGRPAFARTRQRSEAGD
jgi:hypothetical protein